MIQLPENPLLDFLVDHCSIGIFAKDCTDEFRYLIWNRTLENMFDMPRSDVLSHRDRDILDPELALVTESEDRELIVSNKPVQFQYSLQMSGKPFTLKKTKCVYRDKDGSPLILFGFIEDKTADSTNQELAKTLIGNFAQEIVNRNIKYIKYVKTDQEVGALSI